MLKEHETRIHIVQNHIVHLFHCPIVFFSTHSHTHMHTNDFFLKKMYVIQNRKEEGKKYYESKRLPENPIRYT